MVGDQNPLAAPWWSVPFIFYLPATGNQSGRKPWTWAGTKRPLPEILPEILLREPSGLPVTTLRGGLSLQACSELDGE